MVQKYQHRVQGHERFSKGFTRCLRDDIPEVQRKDYKGVSVNLFRFKKCFGFAIGYLFLVPTQAHDFTFRGEFRDRINYHVDGDLKLMADQPGNCSLYKGSFEGSKTLIIHSYDEMVDITLWRYTGPGVIKQRSTKSWGNKLMAVRVKDVSFYSTEKEYAYYDFYIPDLDDVNECRAEIIPLQGTSIQVSVTCSNLMRLFHHSPYDKHVANLQVVATCDPKDYSK